MSDDGNVIDAEDGNVIDVDFRPLASLSVWETLDRLIKAAEKELGYPADPAIRTLAKAVADAITQYCSLFPDDYLPPEQVEIMKRVCGRITNP